MIGRLECSRTLPEVLDQNELANLARKPTVIHNTMQYSFRLEVFWNN